MSFAIGYSFFVAKIRYRLPIEPYILSLSVYGLRQTCSILAGQRIREEAVDGAMRGTTDAPFHPTE